MDTVLKLKTPQADVMGLVPSGESSTELLQSAKVTRQQQRSSISDEKGTILTSV